MVADSIKALLFTTFSFLFVNCSEVPIAPTVPPDYFTEDLVGCWELIESDEFFEGNLFITLDGKGVEYRTYGTTFQTSRFSFHILNHTLADDELTFRDRTYRRYNYKPEKSPCLYYPDDGMIKLYHIDDGYALSIRVKYDRERKLFLEKRKIWSLDFDLECDSTWFIVREHHIQKSDGIRNEYNEFWGDYWATSMRDKQLVSSMALPYGVINDVEMVERSPIGKQWRAWIYYSDTPYYMSIVNWLFRLGSDMMTGQYFAPSLGVVATTYAWDEVDPLASDHRAEIVNYFNPLTTSAAKQARADWNLLLSDR